MSAIQYDRRHLARDGIAVMLLVVALGTVGCGASGRRSVFGEVTLDGQPLDQASILFVPIGDTPGGKSGATVSDGEYEIGGAAAPAIGLFRVEIWKLGQNVHLQDGVAMIEDSADTEIPEIYNSRSTLEALTTADGENRFDFHLITERKGNSPTK